MSDVYDILVNELRNDPRNFGYRSMTVDQIVKTLSDPNLDARPDHSYKTMRSVIKALMSEGIDPKRTITAMETAATNDPVIAEGLRALRYYGEGGGLDFADPSTVAMIDGLVQAGVLLPEEGNAIKKLGIVRASRAEVLGIPLSYVDWEHVATAMRLLGWIE